jgi:multicomponent Na+:H+ antiporter subunit F
MTIQYLSAFISEIIMILALGLAFLRLVKGPHIADRIVALDLLAIIMAGFMAVHTIRSGNPVYLDVVGTLAIIAFLGTVAFARYLERKVMK